VLEATRWAGWTGYAHIDEVAPETGA